MKRWLSLLAAVLVICATACAPSKSSLDKLKTVYEDNSVTFRQIDKNTWIGSGNLTSSESLYLLEGTKRAVLIDAGTDIPDLDVIVAGITDKPVTLVLTHVHPDHAGAAGCFDEVWINPGDTVNVSQFMPDYKGRIKFLENGQKLDLGGRILEVLFTPGHTPGSVTFLEVGTDRGYCGDAFGAGSGMLVFCDMETMIETCRTLYPYFNDKGYKQLYCGHFYGANFITLDKIQFIESVAAEVRDGKIESVPKEGVFGLNSVAVKGDFKMSYIRAESPDTK